MARAASSSSAKSKRTASQEAAANTGNFELRSLQEQFEKDRRFKAGADSLLHLYEQMLLIRRFEEKAGQLYGLGLIGGFCHLYIGRAAGISHGKGGSMHMFSTEHGFYGGHGIVGAQVSLGGGLAFAHKYRNDGGLCLAYFGDGAANQGQVYETMNMASLWDLPIVFVVENNQYAMGTSVKRSSAETEFYRRGTAFRIPGMDVNGMDVLEVRQAAEVAFAHVRGGNGPVLMELNTYRYRGHSMSDPAKYRTREEVQGVRDNSDPIEGAKADLIKMGVDEDKLKDIDKRIKAQVAEAADFAESSPLPAENELYTDVLVGSY